MDGKATSRLRRAQRTCWQLHPGLCRQVEGAGLRFLKTVQKHMYEFLTANCSKKEEGMALFCLAEHVPGQSCSSLCWNVDSHVRILQVGVKNI